MRGWRTWGRGALVALALFLIVVSLLPLWWTDRWWVRLWDFPRLQVATLLLAVIIILFFVRPGRWRWPLIVATAAALAWQVSHFLAYFPPYPKQVQSTPRCSSGRELSLLNANVLMTNRDYAALTMVEQRRPDVLLPETDKG
jgi:hypothetical protein